MAIAWGNSLNLFVKPPAVPSFQLHSLLPEYRRAVSYPRNENVSNALDWSDPNSEQCCDSTPYKMELKSREWNGTGIFVAVTSRSGVLPKWTAAALCQHAAKGRGWILDTSFVIFQYLLFLQTQRCAHLNLRGT